MSIPAMAQSKSIGPSKYHLLNYSSKKALKALTKSTEEIMQQFNDSFQKHDPSLLNNLISPSCVMETIQGPDGVRYEGYEACLNFWQTLASDKKTQFVLEEVFIAGDRATIRWRYFWGERKENTVRGVNLMRVDDGKIIEALGYSKTAPTTGIDN